MYRCVRPVAETVLVVSQLCEKSVASFDYIDGQTDKQKPAQVPE